MYMCVNGIPSVLFILAIRSALSSCIIVCIFIYEVKPLHFVLIHVYMYIENVALGIICFAKYLLDATHFSWMVTECFVAPLIYSLRLLFSFF